MGTEYRITSDRPLNRERLGALLKSLPHFAQFEASFATYDFRDPGNPSEMPNVSVKIEEDKRIYVCDYGGQPLATAVIGALMIHLVHDLCSSAHLQRIE